MKKNVKVFEIKAIAANGNDRTVYAVVTLDVTLADAWISGCDSIDWYVIPVAV